MGVKCLAQKHNAVPRPGLEPGPFDPAGVQRTNHYGGHRASHNGSSLETSLDQNSIHIPKLCVYLIITHAIISA